MSFSGQKISENNDFLYFASFQLRVIGGHSVHFLLQELITEIGQTMSESIKRQRHRASTSISCRLRQVNRAFEVKGHSGGDFDVVGAQERTKTTSQSSKSLSRST